MRLLLFTLMMLMHYIADFILQTDVIANGKQKSWWAKNYPDEMYKDDWKSCLMIHGFVWGACVVLPYFVYTMCCINMPTQSKDWMAFFLYGTIFVNAIIHCIIDDLKCNRKSISLAFDQNLHILQVILCEIITRIVMYKLMDPNVIGI